MAQPRQVICIALNGERKTYESVAQAARELQLTKDTVRTACNRRLQERGIWFKYKGDKDAATAPGPPDPGQSHWAVVCVPNQHNSESVALHCKDFGLNPVTSIDVTTGCLDCNQFCVASGNRSRPLTARSTCPGDGSPCRPGDRLPSSPPKPIRSPSSWCSMPPCPMRAPGRTLMQPSGTCSSSTDCILWRTGTSLQAVIGQEAYAELLASAAAPGLQDEVRTGLFYRPVPSAQLCDASPLISAQVAHFVKSLVVYYVSGNFNRALHARATAALGTRDLLLMRIPRVPAQMRLVLREQPDADE